MRYLTMFKIQNILWLDKKEVMIFRYIFEIGGISLSVAMCVMAFFLDKCVGHLFGTILEIMGVLLVLFAIYLVLLERVFFDKLI